MDKTVKYICIHGHFYQPPRENAWTDSIPLQKGAAPFLNWNAKINAECYATNAAARIKDEAGIITHIVNNYAKISFNMGPTLLSWLEIEDPASYQRILEADKASQKQFSGHGSAMAQVHSHVIMPLANTRDKVTQVAWGVQDFEYRFGRKPEGIWLAETAVDTPTLETLADFDIKFTVLAPRQAKAFKKIDDTTWTDIEHEQFDTRRPYWCVLPSGRKIALFFYNGPVSQAVAFEGLLHNGKRFAKRLTTAFSDKKEPQLVHIATDGESYGHHHRFGEMALADCLQTIDHQEDVQLTNYGEYLEKFPPTYQMRIHEESSWSCVHGVERWRSNCGCSTGGEAGWTQNWRAPLRATLDWLQEVLEPIFEAKGGELFKDVWAARDAYMTILLDNSAENKAAFLSKFARKNLTKNEQQMAFDLLEMQRFAILMYTSCGWFFNEVSGIETNQILQYALRAAEYGELLIGNNFQSILEEKIAAIPSNKYDSALENYQEKVLPNALSDERIALTINQLGENTFALNLLNRYLKVAKKVQPKSIWKESQNAYFKQLQYFRSDEKVFPNEAWKMAFYELGKQLNFKIS